MKKLLLISYIIALLSMNTFCYAQSEEDQMAYQAYISNSKGLWKALVEKRQASYTSNNTMHNLYQLSLAQHGLLNATMVDRDEALFDKHLDAAKNNLETLISSDYEPGNSRAVLSSIYGMEMGYSSWKGMFLGPKSSKHLEKAIKKAPESPLVWQIQGSSKLFTPSMFGGDKQEALQAFKRSVELYEAGTSSLTPNWRYLDAYAWLGQCYEALGKPDEARKVYEKALSLEPEFNWVKNGLLPRLNLN